MLLSHLSLSSLFFAPSSPAAILPRVKHRSCAPLGQCGLIQRDGCTVRSAELTEFRVPGARRQDSRQPDRKLLVTSMKASYFKVSPLCCQRRQYLKYRGGKSTLMRAKYVQILNGTDCAQRAITQSTTRS